MRQSISTYESLANDLMKMANEVGDSVKQGTAISAAQVYATLALAAATVKQTEELSRQIGYLSP